MLSICKSVWRNGSARAPSEQGMNKEFDTVLHLVNALMSRWRYLDPDALHDGLDAKIWPLVDTYLKRHPESTCLAYSIGAALYYLETIEEQLEAHRIQSGLYNEWRAALSSERFPVYSIALRAEHALLSKLRASPLALEMDLFWLAFPNNIHANAITPTQWTTLMTLAPHSRLIQQYLPLGNYLLAHGAPRQWMSQGGDPLSRAEEGLQALEYDLPFAATQRYKQGTFGQ